MDKKEVKDFIDGINESVNFTDSSDMVLSIKKCADCPPVVLQMQKSYKYGRFKVSIDDSESTAGTFKNVDSGL